MSSQFHFSTGFPAVDGILGEIREGDFILWSSEEAHWYHTVVLRWVEWARSRAYPVLFIQGDGGVAEAVPQGLWTRTFSFSHPDQFETLASELHDAASDLADEPCCLVADYLTPGMVERLGPVLQTFVLTLVEFVENRRGMGYLSLSPALLKTGQTAAAVDHIPLILSAVHAGEMKQLQVIKAQGRYSPGQLKSYRLQGGALLPVAAEADPQYSPRLEKKAEELATLLREAERAMARHRRNEAYLSNILEYSTEAIITLDIRGFIHSWNTGAQRMFGYPPEEALGKPFTALIGGEGTVKEELEKALPCFRDRAFFNNFTFKAFTKAGQPLIAELTNTQLLDDRGNLVGNSVIMRDVSHRIRAEEHLKRLLEEEQLFHDISRELVRTRDMDGILRMILLGVTYHRGLGFNRAFLLMYRPDLKQLRGEMAVGPLTGEEAHKIWDQLGTSNVTVSELFRASEHPSKEWDRAANELVKTLRFRVEDASTLLGQVLLRGEPVIVHTDTAANHLDPGLAEALGTREFVVAPIMWDHNPIGLIIADNAIEGKPIDERKATLLAALANQASAAIQRAKMDALLAAKMEALEDANRQLREQQEKLLRSERLSAIGEMSTTIAHEIRNPLTSIGGHAKMLMRKFGQKEHCQESLATIVSEVERLERLVNDVGHFSRVSSMELCRGQINSLVEEVARQFQGQADDQGVVIELSLDPNIPVVFFDRHKMKQVWVNLLVNALQATPAGGRITLKSELRDHSVAVSIIDTGRGIPDSVKEKVANPFFTTKSTGTGLGLTIAQRIIQEHSGFLRIFSTEGQGTTVMVELPLLTEERHAEMAKATEQAALPGKFTFSPSLTEGTRHGG